MTATYAPHASDKQSRSGRTAALLLSLCALGAGGFAAWGVSRSTAPPFEGVYRESTVPITVTDSAKLQSISLATGAEVTPGTVIAKVTSISLASQVQALAERETTIAAELSEATAKAAVETGWRIEELARQELDLRLRYAELLQKKHDVQVKRAALQERMAAESTPPIAAWTNANLQPVSLDEAPSAETPGDGKPGLILGDPSSERLAIATLNNQLEVLGTQIVLCEDRFASLDTTKQTLTTEIARSHGVERLLAEQQTIARELAELKSSPTGRELQSQVHGRVGVYRHRVGETLLPGETLVEVFDAQRPYILLTVALPDAEQFPVGQPVDLFFANATSRKPMKGVVEYSDIESERFSDVATVPGTITAEVHIKPSGRLWPQVPPGTSVKVRPTTH